VLINYEIYYNLVLELGVVSFASEGVSGRSSLLLGSSSCLEVISLSVVVTERNNNGMDSFCI
jgi:hypothetical protein